LTSLASNQCLTTLNLSSTNLGADSSRALCKLLEQNSTLKSCDFSCNNLPPKDSFSLVKSFEANKSVSEMDLRKSGVNNDALEDIKAALKKRFAAEKRLKRIALQSGWDENF
jgi:hypothetical protein